jgi:hypothetical protein
MHERMRKSQKAQASRHGSKQDMACDNGGIRYFGWSKDLAERSRKQARHHIQHSTARPLARRLSQEIIRQKRKATQPGTRPFSKYRHA